MIPRIRIRGLSEFSDFISGFSRNLRGIVTEAIGKYVIGDEGGPSHGLKKYPPYKNISRKSAYGKTFVSDRQRRYIMARIREGSIEPGYPHRTGKLQRGWQMGGKGAKAYIFNDQPHAPYVMGDETQARQPAKVGWRRVSDVISTNINGAIKWAEYKIRQYQESRQK